MPHRYSASAAEKRYERAIRRGYLQARCKEDTKKSRISVPSVVASRTQAVAAALSAHRTLERQNRAHHHSASCALNAATALLTQAQTDDFKKVIRKGNAARHMPWKQNTVRETACSFECLGDSDVPGVPSTDSAWLPPRHLREAAGDETPCASNNTSAACGPLWAGILPECQKLQERVEQLEAELGSTLGLIQSLKAATASLDVDAVFLLPHGSTTDVSSVAPATPADIVVSLPTDASQIDGANWLCEITEFPDDSSAALEGNVAHEVHKAIGGSTVNDDASAYDDASACSPFGDLLAAPAAACRATPRRVWRSAVRRCLDVVPNGFPTESDHSQTIRQFAAAWMQR